MMSNYKVAVGPYQTGPVRELTFYDSWTLDKNLDDGCTFSFTIPGVSEEATEISELDTDVWLYQNGTLIERFRIIQVSQTWGPSDEDVVSVQAVCYRRLLGSRYVQSQLVFNQVSQGNIIWQLIQHTQAQPYGDLGITAGSLGPSVLRDRTYEIGENILDIITNLTGVIGGPTWDIDENLQLNVSRADLYATNPSPIVLGATASALARPSGAALFGNSVLVTGNTEMTTSVSQDSATLSTDTRGRWEKRASFPSVILQDTLEDHAFGLLTDLQSPTAVWDVQIVPERYFTDSQYELGEFVKLVQPATVVAPVGQPAVELDGQVLAMQIVSGASGEIRVSMKVMQLASPEIIAVNAASDVTAGGYRTIKWLESGMLISTRSEFDIEYLVVGGGGGGGGAGTASRPGGGGGAGGLKTNVGGSPLTITPGAHSVTVGYGGSGGIGPFSTPNVLAQNGGSSSIGSFVSVSGGGGGGNGVGSGTGNASSGGSGGGAGYYSSTGGTGISGEGKNGGNTSGSGNGAAGGGGSSVAGVSPSTSSGGNGGNGTSVNITGVAITYAGGGGGAQQSGGVAGSGGTGGGGNAASGTTGSSGTDGLGGGGGGSVGSLTQGGNGGSGVVIVRFPV